MIRHGKVLACILSVALGTASAAWAGAITARGSDSTTDVVKALAEAYKAKSGQEVKVEGGGSGKGVKDCLAGEVDIAVLSRDLKAKEKTEGLVGVAYALDAVAIVVNKANTVEGLTLEQLKDFYTGKTTTWPDGKPVLALTRPDGSGTRECFTHFVLGEAKLSEKVVVKHEKAIDATVSKAVTAVAYNSAGAVATDANIKVVKVNGVLPTPATIRDKSYPICRELTLATKGEPKADAKAFLDFVLSADGQKIVQAQSYVPMK